MKKTALSLIITSAAFMMNAQAQHKADHSQSVTAIPPLVVFKHMINSPKIDNQEVQLVLVKFAPGEVSGAHRHPKAAIAYVLEGEIESVFDGKVKRFKKGESFYEDPNLLHAKTINLSKTKPAALLVYFIGDENLPFIKVGDQ